MALALYRKYRPRTFAEVIGQEQVTEPLSQALRNGRLHHAYLFSGPRGCGKTSSARILARSLNCEQGPTPEPCGTCVSCRSLASDGGGSIDVIEIDAASHGGVDDARELRERAFFAPVSSRFKIYVIDEAHMVSTQGFNALLKLVEEPPDYVKFIFATTEPEKVLGTIKSRTHHYPFRLIPPGVLRPYLEQLASAEGVKIELSVFPLVVRAGGGSARDSISVLDQLIAGAGPDGVGYSRAVALLGVTDSALIDEMCDALAAGDGAAAYGTVERVADAGHDPRRFAADLLERLRDLIILRQVPDAAAKGLIDGPTDQIERMTAQAERLGPATLSRCADIVHNGLVEMRGTTAPRLLLELICARMLLPGAEDSTGSLLQRLERLERRLTFSAGQPTDAGTDAAVRYDAAAGSGTTGNGHPGAPTSAPRVPVVTAPATPPVVATGMPAETVAGSGPDRPADRPVPAAAVLPDPATPEPVRPGTEHSGELDAAAVRRVWDEILNLVGRQSKKVAAWLREATVRDVDGDTLVLTFRHAFHARALSNQPELLIQVVYEVLGGRWQVRCEVAGEQRAADERRTAAQPGPARSAPEPATRPAPASPSGDADDWPEPARPGGVAGSVREAAGDADDWPEPARPGATASPATSNGSADPRSPGTSGLPAGAQGARADRPGVPPNDTSGTSTSGTGTDTDTDTDTDTSTSGTGGSTRPSREVPRDLAGQRTVPGRPGTPADGTGVAVGDGPAGGGTADGRASADGGARVGAGLAAARAVAAGRGRRSGSEPALDQAPTADRDWAGEPPHDPEYDGPSRGVARYEGFDPGDEPLDEVVDERTARQTSEQQAVQLLQQTFRAERIGEIEAS